MVDRCIQFLTFISERNDRYMVLLEQLCREEFENEQTIGQALLSDMLREECPKTCVHKNALCSSCTIYLKVFGKAQVFALDLLVNYILRKDCDVVHLIYLFTVYIHV